MALSVLPFPSGVERSVPQRSLIATCKQSPNFPPGHQKCCFPNEEGHHQPRLLCCQWRYTSRKSQLKDIKGSCILQTWCIPYLYPWAVGFSFVLFLCVYVCVGFSELEDETEFLTVPRDTNFEIDFKAPDSPAPFCHHCHWKVCYWRTSLVAQWLRTRLPMQGTRVWSLVRKIPHASEQ